MGRNPADFRRWNKIWMRFCLYPGLLCETGGRVCRWETADLYGESGFPNGYHTTATKFREKGCGRKRSDEIDMVINIGFLKDKRYDDIEQEIRKIHEACSGKTLKVIIETCLLTDEEKIKMCEIVTNADAEFIKTSTGFSTAGATFSDVELMRQYVGTNVKVKAAGGISSLDDAEKFLSLGADRLGTSRIVKIIKNEEATGY